MTVGLASSVVNGWLDGTFSTTNAWVKLHTADPGSAGATAAAAGDTTRKQATMASASGGPKAMTGTAGPWTNGGTSETLTHISVWDASSAGNFLYSASLTASQAWASTNTFTLNTLTVAITPLAA